MIISVSRRTDIPAFYSEWFMNRIRAGYCTVPNPFNHNQVSWVSLKPEDVDVFVFWTRNPNPLIPYLDELDQLGYHYYFQYTVLGYPNEIDHKSPSLNSSIKTFRKLSRKIGSNRVIWRYDPIVFSQNTGVQYHIEKYQKIAQELDGYTFRSVISVVDVYAKAKKRLRDLKDQGVEIVEYDGKPSSRFDELMVLISETAKNHHMEIVSCAERLNLATYGIQPGKCVDDDYIRKTFDIQVGHKKDTAQREECGCVVSKDIGMYDSCLYGCQYCYATHSFERAKINFTKHDPTSPSLIGNFQAEEKENTKKTKNQLKLFDQR